MLTHSIDLSRRRLLRGAIVVASALAAAAAGPAQAVTKVSQKTANYQPTPRGGARCNVCSLWQQPSDCKVVEGPVSPTGWCVLYVAKW